MVHEGCIGEKNRGIIAEELPKLAEKIFYSYQHETPTIRIVIFPYISHYLFVVTPPVPGPPAAEPAPPPTATHLVPTPSVSPAYPIPASAVPDYSSITVSGPGLNIVEEDKTTSFYISHKGHQGRPTVRIEGNLLLCMDGLRHLDVGRFC